jgi:L-erythro-3,5-diaminohexanoate dehydrogenase
LIQDPARTGRRPGSPLGLHRVLEPAGVLPQAAWRLDADPAIWPDEVRVAVDRLNLDAASYRQLRESTGGSAEAMRGAVLDIVAGRGKMQNPVTGSGGMLTGVVDEAGPASPLGLAAGDRIATLVSLSLTPLAVTDGLARWDGQSEQVPCAGHAILFGRSIAAVLPADLPAALALAVMDVCGAPALTERVVRESAARRGAPEARSRRAADGREPGAPGVVPREGGSAGPGGQPPTAGEARRAVGVSSPSQSSRGVPGGRPPGPAEPGPVVAILGAGGKSGSLSAAAARRAGAGTVIGVVPAEAEAAAVRRAGLADQVVVADARDPVALADAVRSAGGPAAVTVVCVDVPGCEGGAVLATAPGGTVIFFSMATSFSAAALGAEGVAADVTMLIGNGYVPGHAELALDLLRSEPGVRALYEARLTG